VNQRKQFVFKKPAKPEFAIVASLFAFRMEHILRGAMRHQEHAFQILIVNKISMKERDTSLQQYPVPASPGKFPNSPREKQI